MSVVPSPPRARYPTVLFDLDHTLFDTDASEASAFEAALAGAGVPSPRQHLAAYVEINQALWRAVERHETTPAQVRTARFEQLVVAQGIDADPFALADAFAAGLGEHGELFPGAREVLDALAGHASLGLVTNGLGEVQRARLSRLDLDRYFDVVVISAEVGCAKPGTAIFDLAFARWTGADRRPGALMVGDSLSSDIRGGRAAGIATCWYNPGLALAGDDDRFDHEIRDLAELVTLVAGGPAG